jgi:hypothetical protein
MKTVEFLDQNPPYRIGDIAGFEDEIAKRLVEGGKAKYFKPEKAKNLDSPPEDKMVRSGEIKKK